MVKGPSTPAIGVLQKAGVEFTAHTYVHRENNDAGYGLEAASELGLEPGRVFKTLMCEVDGSLVTAIVPVDRMVDLKALAKAVGGKKAAMADPAAAQRATGYVVGGISPLGQRQRHRTVVDASASGWPTVFVSGGKRGLDVELPPEDLIRLTGGASAEISR